MMALTRADTEFLIVARVGSSLAAADMSIVVDGTNVDLNGPIGRSIRELGYSVAQAVLVTDADVAQVTDAQTDQFLDVTELHALEAILGNYDDVDLRVGPRTESFSQLAKQLEAKVKRLMRRNERLYGYGLSEPTAGYIELDFAEHGT